MTDLRITDEEHEDVQHLIVAAAVCASPDPRKRDHAVHLTKGLAAIVKAKYGELERLRNTKLPTAKDKP